MKYHEPVLLAETLSFLNVKEGEKYIDCTLGDGGHTIEILKKGGVVLGMDYNLNSLETALERIKVLGLSGSFTGIQGNFSNVYEAASKAGFINVSGILFDLGYSTSQLEETSLGLSFLKDAPLDMRLDTSQGVSAADLINTLGQKQLESLFREYGEERKAREFSKAIVNARSSKRFTSTLDLANLLNEVAPSGYDHGRMHPATRVFQALRIVVNNELENLKTALPEAVRLLKLPGGRMLVISFHSLEDRIVKEFGRSVQPGDEFVKLSVVVKKPIVPTDVEIRANRRSRSAKLRVFELTKNEF